MERTISRRWHRDKRNSGGLCSINQPTISTLLTFGSEQLRKLFCNGGFRFYGRENAEKRGVEQFYSRSHGDEAAKNDPFGLDMASNPYMKAMYLDAEKEDGYFRDQSVFGDGISIEDTMGLLVKYKNKAMMTYSLNTFLPWEGYNIAFNGTKGRMEAKIVEMSYVNSGGDVSLEGALQESSIIVFPLLKPPYKVDLRAR